MRWWSIWAIALAGCMASVPAVPAPADSDGDGIPDERDLCPQAPENVDGFQDGDGCPELDTDRDGIMDVRDGCPDQPEDHGGFQDDDGCPTPDNDQGRMPDDRDKCPNDPEAYNSVDDDYGCPDIGDVRAGTGLALSFDPIHFEGGGTRINDWARSALDRIAATILQNPEFAVIEIIGHADPKEREPARLASARAAAVEKALVARKVPRARLHVQSVGASRPVCVGDLEHCQAPNRRVEIRSRLP